MKFAKYVFGAVVALAALALAHIDPALAQEAEAAATPAAPTLSAGDTAWMLTSTALVLMMTIPGLALFYGGMVRKKNVLATVMQSFAITCIVTVVWMVIAYSLAFTDGGSMNAYIGGMSRFLLKDMEVGTLKGTIPESVFMCFQMTFAIITPALICGAFADRMKFSALVIFMVLWQIIVYAPIAHWVWGGGFLGGLGVLDFAGGTVVHINAGVAGLVCALYLGKRVGYGTENMSPYNLVYAVIGASLLWVGWFGFNAGSELAADGRAGYRHDRHANRDGRGGAGLDVLRMAGAQEAKRTRHHLRRRCRPGGHHPGVGLCRPGWLAVDRCGCRRRLLLCRHHPQESHRL